MGKKEIYITKPDMERCRALIEIYGGNEAPYLERLEEELDRAKVVESKNIPGDVVTMNSVVCIRDLDTGEETRFALAFPGRTGTTEKTVSILAPVGTAIIGYREGDTIELEVPSGRKKFQLVKVIYQPERFGDYDT